MKRRKATPEEMERLEAVRSLHCVACHLHCVYNQPLPTEAHHLNLGGKAGQKRRGHLYTIPLCQWHHQGKTIKDTDTKAMTALYGPSLKLQSKLFRVFFGTDDELLARTNEMLQEKAA